MKTETITISESGKNHYCGRYGFCLMSGRLVVLAIHLNPSNPPQYHYELRDLPQNHWFVLEDTHGECVRIYILWKRVTLQVWVGSPPHPGEIPRWAVRECSRAWSFKIRKYSTYTHPEGGFWIRGTSGPHGATGDEIMVGVNATGEAVRMNTTDLQERQLSPIHHLIHKSYPLWSAGTKMISTHVGYPSPI